MSDEGKRWTVWVNDDLLSDRAPRPEIDRAEGWERTEVVPASELDRLEAELRRHCACEWMPDTTGEEGPYHTCPYHADHQAAAEARVREQDRLKVDKTPVQAFLSELYGCVELGEYLTPERIRQALEDTGLAAALNPPADEERHKDG